MSGYTPPGAQGQHGAYQAPQPAGGYSPPSPSGSAGALPLFDLIGAALGVLMWVWGFLNWFDLGGKSQGFFFGLGTAPIALSLAAAVIGVAGLVVRSDAEDKLAGQRRSFYAAGLSAASVLLVFGSMIAHPDGVKSKIGVILGLITAIVQTAVFVVAFLEKKGIVPALAGPRPQRGQPQQQFSGGYGPGYQQGYQAPPQSVSQQQGYQGYQAPQQPEGQQQTYQGYQGYQSPPSSSQPQPGSAQQPTGSQPGGQPYPGQPHGQQEGTQQPAAGQPGYQGYQPPPSSEQQGGPNP